MTSVHGDPQRLTQVFSNLLNNASRRTPAGGDILLAMAAGDDQVAISVAHEGVGIAPDALPHIFDLFTLDTNVPIDESGLGIGLAVVHELVKAHGGSVSREQRRRRPRHRVRRSPAARALAADRRQLVAPELGRRHAAEAGADVVVHVLAPPRAGDRAGDGGMAEDELEQQLRPARAADLGGPRGSGLPSSPRSRPPPPNGMLTMTATPRSAASGRRRRSASRSSSA